MNNKEFDQLKSYSTVLVSELHKIVFDESLFSRLREVLKLAEEMECEIMNIERKRKENASNIFQLKRIA